MQEGYAPLHAAAAKGHDDMVCVLLEAGANLDLQNKVRKSFIGSSSSCCSDCVLYCACLHRMERLHTVLQGHSEDEMFCLL